MPDEIELSKMTRDELEYYIEELELKNRTLAGALQGIESVRKMQVRNIEDLAAECDELKLALTIMLASHSDWVHLNKTEQDFFKKKYTLHRDMSGSRVTYSITRVEGVKK